MLSPQRLPFRHAPMTRPGSLGIPSEFMTFPTIPYLTCDIAIETMASEIFSFVRSQEDKISYSIQQYLLFVSSC